MHIHTTSYAHTNRSVPDLEFYAHFIHNCRPPSWALLANKYMESRNGAYTEPLAKFVNVTLHQPCITARVVVLPINHCMSRLAPSAVRVTPADDVLSQSNDGDQEPPVALILAACASRIRCRTMASKPSKSSGICGRQAEVVYHKLQSRRGWEGRQQCVDSNAL